jgi:gliding motility-associated-like protein
VTFENDSAWYSYKWVFDDGTIEFGKFPEHKFTITNTYTIQLTIEDTLCNNSFQFSFTDYFLISENRLFIPNSFTPNFDDKNELFIISGNSCLKNSSLVILSSYGEEIFRTDNPFEEFWDGTYNGKPAQGDTYIYRFESEKLNKNGYIVLYH